MIEKSESNQLSLATAPILGQAPRVGFLRIMNRVLRLDKVIRRRWYRLRAG
ncbi:MAG: hypothetical protein GY792_17750 [Gammaproteobacteria bacterium]|nr:hypothetical protein [Gammaproteobacteria bacterium]